MVEFGGWEMPIQYPTGIVQEHLATRRAAGLFDVSHMGRYRVRGPDAEAFLLKALTNNAQVLNPGQAQYTFIADETGGAIDDAYLYRLEIDDFLLVVNAVNREKDWNWLETLKSGNVELKDESEDLGMIALQGPEASLALERLVDRHKLPENKRNQLRKLKIDGCDVFVARTGYTGEAICFELFPLRDFTVSLWQQLVDVGASPAGLGARDSLRLEAGLPLYGHELGQDPKGNQIPIFANRHARFGVRRIGTGDYMGRTGLEKQRAEYKQIMCQELDLPVDNRVLSHLIQPIAAFEDRKPLRAGYSVIYKNEYVGYVTSGTSVPFIAINSREISATPINSFKMRPIGLALLRSDILYNEDQPVMLQIEDSRNKLTFAKLVERNL